MEMHAYDDDIVHVPVPRQHLGAVYEALAAAMTESRPGINTGPPPEMARAHPIVPWTEEDIQRLKRINRWATVETIMDFVSESVGREISFSEAQERAGRTVGEARADLAQLTRTIRQQFGRNNWPFQWRTRAGGLLVYYLNSEDVARWWREAM
jgi:hypothetical protein